MVSARILEAVMQTCMGKVCRGLVHLAAPGLGCFYLGFAKSQDRVHGPAASI